MPCAETGGGNDDGKERFLMPSWLPALFPWLQLLFRFPGETRRAAFFRLRASFDQKSQGFSA
jgi:hypothetical protein